MYLVQGKICFLKNFQIFISTLWKDQTENFFLTRWNPTVILSCNFCWLAHFFRREQICIQTVFISRLQHQLSENIVFKNNFRKYMFQIKSIKLYSLCLQNQKWYKKINYFFLITLRHRISTFWASCHYTILYGPYTKIATIQLEWLYHYDTLHNLN